MCSARLHKPFLPACLQPPPPRSLATQSPSGLLPAANRTYKFCAWARLGPNSPGRVNTTISLMGTTAGSTEEADVLAQTTVELRDLWRRACIGKLRLGNDTNGYFTMTLGDAAGTYYLDDVTLEYYNYF